MIKGDTGPEEPDVPSVGRTTMSATANSFCIELLQDTMTELAALRQETLAIPHQGEIDSAIEAIDFYERELPRYNDTFRLIEWCGRAMYEVRNEVAIARYGFQSPETEAVY